MIKVIELSATIARHGPSGPFDNAILMKFNPIILMKLPTKPTINISN